MDAINRSVPGRFLAFTRELTAIRTTQETCTVPNRTRFLVSWRRWCHGDLWNWKEVTLPLSFDCKQRGAACLVNLRCQHFNVFLIPFNPLLENLSIAFKQRDLALQQSIVLCQDSDSLLQLNNFLKRSSTRPYHTYIPQTALNRCELLVENLPLRLPVAIVVSLVCGCDSLVAL